MVTLHKKIPGWPGYWAGSDGTIWSQKIQGIHRIPGSWREVQQCKNIHGYFMVGLWREGAGKTVAVHRLILLTFLGPCPLGLECCHNDGNPTNNRVENLRWDTRKNNHADKLKHGTEQRGERIGTSKLTTENVRSIKMMLSEGKRQTDIGKIFGVDNTTISMIARKRTWRHIEATSC